MSKGILLLSCCAPCSCAVIEKLAKDQVLAEVVFYNPNIRPEAEYRKRCEENKRVCECGAFRLLSWNMITAAGAH